jgi:2-dehydropantoate 2-reductase
VTAQALNEPYDLVLLSCKAYDLEAAIGDIATAVGPGTSIVPLLNGMTHLRRLDERFGTEHVLGGLCQISATLGEDGTVHDLAGFRSLVFGERQGGPSARTAAILELMQGAKFDGRASHAILLEMWEKWLTLATMAGITCLMRAPIGDIVAGGGAPLALALLDETIAVAAANGFAPRAETIASLKSMVVQPGSLIAASMFRDIERGGPTEGEHILGDFLARAGDLAGPYSLLRIATTHLRVYEARRAREAATAKP